MTAAGYNRRPFKEERVSDRLRLLTWAFAATALTAGACGCGRSDRSSPAGQEEKITRETPPPDQANAADEPADGMRRLAAGLAGGRAEAVVEAVPARYLSDLDRFLAERVRPVDPVARREAAEAVTGLAEALGQKRDFVLASERIEIAGPAVEVVRGRFDALCRLVAATANWPGWAAAEARDAKSLVGAVATAVAADPALSADLRSLRFEAVSQEGDRAIVKVAHAGDASGRGLTVVRVDGKWVPAAFAERWDAMFVAGMDSGSQSGGGLPEFAGRLREVTAALREVTTQAEFDALADQAATRLLATAAESDRGPRAVKPEEYVTVVVLGPLTDEQKDQVVWKLSAATDAPSSGLADAADRTDGGLTVNVGPIADVADFANRLADLKVEQVDAEKKTVTARFVGP